MADDAITVSGLTKRYGDHVAVDGVSFEVHRGEAFGILGPNGAGKTTTLEMIEGLRPPDGGEVHVLGLPVWPHPERVQQRIGVQLQTTSLFDRLTARELLVLFAEFYRHPDSNGRADHALELVGLESKAETRSRRLSGGQQQRLAIALALVHDPELVFLDEPTTGLDVVTQARILSEIARLQRESDVALVYVSHDLAVVSSIADRVAVMYAGRIVEEGPT